MKALIVILLHQTPHQLGLQACCTMVPIADWSGYSKHSYPEPRKKKYQSNSFITHPHSRSLKKKTNILYAWKVWVNTQANERTPSRGSLIVQWCQAHTWWVLVLSLTMATGSKLRHMPFVNSTKRRASTHPKSCRWFGVAFVHRPMRVTTDRVFLGQVQILCTSCSGSLFRFCPQITIFAILSSWFISSLGKWPKHL